MDGLKLLAAARDAGLTLACDGDRLVIRGPRAAEPVARRLIEHKPEVLAAIAEGDSCRARHREALAYHRALHLGAEAEQLAWGEMEDRWHRKHGARASPELCAGCGRPIGSRVALALLDDNRVHLDSLDCLIQHGERWRRAASNALVALRLIPPTGAEPRP